MTSLPGNPYAEHLTGYEDPRNSLEMMATLALAYETRTQTLAILATAPAQEFSEPLRHEYNIIDQRLGREPEKMVQD
jgi:hypothetical protein